MTLQANVPANSSYTYGVSYNDPQYTEHDFEQSTIGVPHVAASGISTGNGAYPIFTSPANCFIYSVIGTITQVGTGAGSTVALSLVRANNGANISNTLPSTVFNVVTTGINAAGNLFYVELSYNLYSNGVNSGSNLVSKGGIYCNTGDVLLATHTGNTLVVSTAVEYSLAPANAVIHV